MPRKRGRQDKGVIQHPCCSRCVATYTTPPQSRTGTVKPPDTPVTLEPKRARRAEGDEDEDEEINWELEAANWRVEAAKWKVKVTGSEAEAAVDKLQWMKGEEERDNLRERVRSLGVLVAVMSKELNEVRGVKKQLGRELLKMKREADSKAEGTQRVCDAEFRDLKAPLQFYRETLAAERAREKERSDGGIDKSTQSGGIEVAAMGTQTARRTYASVMAQTEEASNTQSTEDRMDVDGTSKAPRGESNMPDDLATKKLAGTMPVGGRPVRAFVVHRVACSGPWAHRSREMEKAFGCRGGGVIGMRWLLQWDRRRGRPLPPWWCI